MNLIEMGMRVRYAAFPDGVPTRKTFFKSFVRAAWPSLIDPEPIKKPHTGLHGSIQHNVDNRQTITNNNTTNNITYNVFGEDYSFDNNYAKNDPDLDNQSINVDYHYKEGYHRKLADTVSCDEMDNRCN